MISAGCGKRSRSPTCATDDGDVPVITGAGSRAQARLSSSGEWHAGRASLERLHAALGAFLAEAPEWARQVVQEGLEDR